MSRHTPLRPAAESDDAGVAGRSDRVPIRGQRLGAARELAQLTVRQLSERLPEKARVSHAQLVRWEQGDDRHGRDHVIKALARVLGVPPAWLRGETSIPIVSKHPWVQALGVTAQGREWSRSNLRLWRAVHRCFASARRDYERIERRKPEGAEWLAIETWLLIKFWQLFDGEWLASRTRTLPADGREPEPFFHAITRQQREDAEASLAFWEVALRPWWEGRAGLDYTFLATVTPGLPQQRRSSPLELLNHLEPIALPPTARRAPPRGRIR